MALNGAQYSLHHVAYTPAKFEVSTSNSSEGDAFTRKYMFTQNVAQYPLHHVTYLGTKFEVAMFKGLGGDTFTRNVTDRCTDRWTLDRVWYEIDIPFFSKEKSGYKNINKLDNCLAQNSPVDAYH